MKSMWLCCFLAFACIASSAQRADAAYRGLVSHKHGAAKLTSVGFASARGVSERSLHCQTSASDTAVATSAASGTRLVKDVVYEQKQFTCYKTICEKVVEQKQIDCVRYETEKSF